MNSIGPDITNRILAGFSSCVTHCAFDVISRSFLIIIVDNPEQVTSERALKWNGLRDFTILPHDSESFNDNCIDAIIGVHEQPDNDLIFLRKTSKFA